ncbi:nuclease [Corynebacterium sp. HMSC06D04]|uniref:ExeM/NucH family extracellular endonuclease n=1 Tax=Corynebacterium sp. HMSC06D04 TaxID=1581123 RepID=UPI0008A64849|nr:ExeM/NucH family extracellular endonuclease [Corynebacterium sp. HMSC06D04]OFT52219.1 nuclease [Corynebacterium sp. HMSC06D04]
MRSRSLRALSLTALISTFSTLTVPAHAAPAGDAVVLSEVYGGGGNSGATFTHDFIELFNPTEAEVSLDGWSVEYFSAGGNSGGKAALGGAIPAGKHYLIQAGQGSGGSTPLPTPDAESSLNLSGSKGSVKLYDASGNKVDLAGYGSAQLAEGTPAPSTSNAESVSRDEAGTDTDDNAADFHVSTPTPTPSGNEPTTPAEPEEPTQPADPGRELSIEEIQGTGAQSPVKDQNVTTKGVVTGVWSEGGINGFTIQTGGTGNEAPAASPALFIYMGNKEASAYPQLGDSVQVSGKVSEFFDATQLTANAVEKLDAPLPEVTALELEALPEGDVAREAYEHMLVLPGTHTVTNNYALNQYGEVGLAPGTEALRQPSDLYDPSTDPDSDLQKLAASNAAKLVTLDDGRTKNYLESDQSTPLPYIAQDNAQTIKSLRTTDQVTFQHPVIVGYSHEQWRYQPTAPVTGNTAGSDLPITWEDSREKELHALDVEGEYTIGAFNVLNYFTSLGEEYGGSSYDDMDGNPVTVKRGTTRGAYTAEAFENQQRKIVAAVNGLDADVIALSEIEDGYGVTGDKSKRDQALAHLTDELNAAAGSEKWAYVTSPEKLPDTVDVIRTAFIYKRARVKPVGESRIFVDDRFTGTAREPLAQEFAPVDAADDETFVAVANHFKSKGSVVKGDADTGDGQGNNPNVRKAQAEAVLEHLAKQPDWQDKATFVMGDLNTYTHGDAIDVFRDSGYTVPAEDYHADASYQFSGLLGSLDHVLANEVVSGKVTDAQVWNINADEPVAFEYSRRNYNIVDFYDDSPFRASDHDPVKVGFSLGKAAANPDEEPDTDPDSKPGTNKGSSSSNGSSSGSSTGSIIALILAVAVPGIAMLLGGSLKFLTPQLIDALPPQVRDFLKL